MSSLETSLYHRILRVSSVVMAVVLLFESGIISQSTTVMARNTHQYVANAIGMSASVEPTELNTLTAELTKQKTALDAREASIKEREIAVGLAPQETTPMDQKTLYIIVLILCVQLVLIVLNYILDFFRSRKTILPSTEQPV
jgi:magnesium-transporting ATPase (P-type)